MKQTELNFFCPLALDEIEYLLHADAIVFNGSKHNNNNGSYYVNRHYGLAEDDFGRIVTIQETNKRGNSH